VARILHVDDEESWRRLVRENLEDHHVDSAVSLNDALRILEATSSYDVALVDLNLKTDSDGEGGELLDLLRSRFPSTRRVVITGRPPGGSLRRNIFERFDVEEIIIKRQFEIPDLRRVVEEAVSQGRGELPQALRLSRSAVRQRFRDWRKTQGERLRGDVNMANEHLFNVGGVSGPSRRRAESAVTDALRRESDFRARCAALAERLRDIEIPESLNLALDALDAAEEEFGWESGAERDDKET